LREKEKVFEMPLPPALAARLAKRGLIQKNEAAQKQGSIFRTFYNL
jgi:hypothetical protein